MSSQSIQTAIEYWKFIQGFEQQHIAQWFFRGVRKEHYELTPSLFRIDINSTLLNWDDLESYMLRQFKREARPFLTKTPESEQEWLALAQHYGLPTRLLDWTTNPLIALFFAVEDCNQENDSAVWCYGFPSTHNCHPVSSRVDRRLELEKMEFILFPNHISQRITNQSGCFTIHDLPKIKEPFIPFNRVEAFGLLEKIIIPRENKKDLLDELYDLGIHSGLIYPGLDGLSKRIKYETTTHKRCVNTQQQEKYFSKCSQNSKIP